MGDLCCVGKFFLLREVVSLVHFLIIRYLTYFRMNVKE
jgi:hypothetical protein